MAPFLSAEWINELNEQLEASDSSPTPVLVQYIVDRDGTEIAYHLQLGPNGNSATAGYASDPDATFLMDWATAQQVSTGQLSSEEAFITGKLRLEGNPTALIDAYRANA